MGGPSRFLLFPLLIFANVITVSGKVTDPATGRGIEDVSVKVKGSHRGTVTDSAGSFTLQADEKARLIFSHIGYDPVEVPVKNNGELRIWLQQSSKALNDVIVIGYGTQKRTLNTAAVPTINKDEIAEKPVVNLTNSLVGRASGPPNKAGLVKPH